MKAAILFSKHPLYTKALYWSKLIIVTGGAQAVVQATGLLTGIIIIRLLSTTEYAYYTLANTMLGTMTLLSDSGISSGVMAQSGKIWQDKNQMGVILASGLELRKKFAIGALSVCLPLLAFLLYRNGASSLYILFVVVTIIPSFWAALSDILLEVGPKLHQQIIPLQKNQTEVSLLRLFLSSVCLALFPVTAIALLINGATRIYGNRKLAKISYKYAEEEARPDALVKKEMMSVVKKIVPPMLYYCFSGQIIIWIPSLLGNTSGIAQVGALSRLAAVLNLFSSMVAMLILPRFARIDSKSGGLVFKSFIYIQILLAAVGICMVLFFYMFPSEFLWILGKSYSNLSHELLLLIISTCIGLMSSQTATLVSSRGWFIHPLIPISINVLSIVLSFYLFDLSEIVGVLYYNILLNAVSYIFTMAYGLSCIRKLNINIYQESRIIS